MPLFLHLRLRLVKKNISPRNINQYINWNMCAILKNCTSINYSHLCLQMGMDARGGYGNLGNMLQRQHVFEGSQKISALVHLLYKVTIQRTSEKCLPQRERERARERERERERERARARERESERENVCTCTPRREREERGREREILCVCTHTSQRRGGERERERRSLTIKK
jgi:hypothetical protein